MIFKFTFLVIVFIYLFATTAKHKVLQNNPDTLSIGAQKTRKIYFEIFISFILQSPKYNSKVTNFL